MTHDTNVEVEEEWNDDYCDKSSSIFKKLLDNLFKLVSSSPDLQTAACIIDYLIST